MFSPLGKWVGVRGACSIHRLAPKLQATSAYLRQCFQEQSMSICTTARSAQDLCIVTGGGSGIGQATALRLLARGATVMIVGHLADQNAATVTLAKEKTISQNLICVEADLCQVDGRKAVAQAVRACGISLRILIQCAGVNTPCKPMMELDEKEWSRVMDINMNVPLYLTRELYPFFGVDDTDKNRILFMQTIVRECTGLPNYGPYCVSKLGAYGIAKMFQQELPQASPAIYCGTLIPGEVDTEMQKNTAFHHSAGFPDHLVQHWRRLQEQGKLLPPEVAGAFIEFVTCDTTPQEYQSREWFMYDADHHKRWATEFPHINIVEPKGLFGDH